VEAAPTSARIRVLDPLVVDQIAAGEVVERPASVVKELVENALDAGATSVRIELEEGGARLVRVVDDGCGMGPEDLALAFASHATSKLREPGDLEHVASLGFRGEALASIASVARCRIVSCPRGGEAREVRCEGGVPSGPMPASGAPGTTVEARDLFFNTPARRKFLKSTATELGRVLDYVQRIALAHEGVAFELLHDKKRVFDCEAGMDLRARVRRAFGAELADALVEVRAQDGPVALSGWVAPPRFARSDASRQMWFLNGRSVRDKVLLRALKDGYRGFLFDSRQPSAFLHLSMDPSLVDVNVHPAKTEVRFRDERRLFGFLVHHLRAAVARCDIATPGARLVDATLRREGRAEASVGRFDYGSPGRGAPSDSTRLFIGESPGRPARDELAGTRAAEAGREAPLPAAATARPVRAGAPLLQVARTYLVREIENGFEVIDQHALHERIQYEDLLARLRAGALESQRLLVPELVEVARSECQLLCGRAGELSRAGIELSALGESTVALHALPARLARPRATAIVRDLVALLCEERQIDAERLLEAALQRAACRSSVMSGDELDQEEMQGLLARGAALLSDQTCVHGRPTRVRFALADLERAFDRR
jgi:DNA mismatch repair protein MutL